MTESEAATTDAKNASRLESFESLKARAKSTAVITRIAADVMPNALDIP